LGELRLLGSLATDEHALLVFLNGHAKRHIEHAARSLHLICSSHHGLALVNGNNQFVAALSGMESWHAVTETIPSPEEIAMKAPFHIDMMVSWLDEDTEMMAGNPKHSIAGTAALDFALVSNVPSTCTAMLHEGDPPESLQLG